MDIQEFSEEQLVHSLNLGNEAAITEIYHRYWRKLLAIAYNHTEEKVAAEEVVQEVLINLWDRRSELKINNLSNYLGLAVKYSVLNSIRRAERRQNIAKENYSNPINNLDEEKIHTRFLQEYINGVVEQLPEKCKLVFKFSRHDGKNTREIAGEMNIAEKTVEAHLTKAIKTIRYALKNAGIVIFIFFISLFLK